jgi:hypothetical protein
MKKLLGIIILSLIFVNNAYSYDLYSEENRKKSEIKINCKINWIMKFANQDGLQASAYDTSDLPKMIENPKLPGFIIETNLNSRPVWINRVAVKADENWRERLSIIRFEQANEKDFVVVRKYNIDFTTKSTKGEDYSFSIDTSIHLHKSDFKGKNIPFNILEADIEDIDLNLKRIKEYFNSTSTSYGGCNKIDSKNFDFEETVVQNEIRIAEYEAKKEKELLNKKKEELKKARISEGKFELNCKDGAKLDPNTKEIISTFTDEMNLLINSRNFSYQNLNFFELDEIHQFINSDKALGLYRLDEFSAQLGVYMKEDGTYIFITHQNINGIKNYKTLKSKFDELNKKIPNYKKQTSIIYGSESYTVPIKLGANDSYSPSIHNIEVSKFSLIQAYLADAPVTVARYQCNKIKELN